MKIGALGLLLLLLLLLGACGADAPPVSSPAPAGAMSSCGSIVWEAAASGEDQETVELFRGLVSRRVRAEFGDGRARIEEEGGVNGGILLLRPGEEGRKWKGIRLDPAKRTFENANWVNDMDAADGQARALTPGAWVTGLAPTDETREILGHLARKHRVTSSAFVEEGAAASLWITDDFDLPRVRVEADFEWSRSKTPLPMRFPLERGAVLAVEVLQNGVLVTYTAVEIDGNAPDPSRFEVPEGYEDAEKR